MDSSICQSGRGGGGEPNFDRIRRPCHWFSIVGFILRTVKKIHDLQAFSTYLLHVHWSKKIHLFKGGVVPGLNVTWLNRLDFGEGFVFFHNFFLETPQILQRCTRLQNCRNANGRPRPSANLLKTGTINTTVIDLNGLDYNDGIFVHCLSSTVFSFCYLSC